MKQCHIVVFIFYYFLHLFISLYLSSNMNIEEGKLLLMLKGAESKKIVETNKLRK